MIPVGSLSALAERLAQATPTAEGELLTAASEILANAPATRERIARYLDASAYSDAAVTLYRATLSDCGFQFGLPPPLDGSAPQRAVATCWRRGDASAMPYLAATPALALLRATVEECAHRHELDYLEKCTACRGLGWYVSADGRRQMCRHGSVRGNAD